MLLRLRDPSSWRRRLRAAVTERLWLKATAFLMAIVIWVIASLKEPTEDELPVRLVLTPAAGTAIVGDVPDVRVLVRAVGRDVLKLHQTPPTIRRRLPAGGDSATVELFPSDVSLPPGVDATIEDVEPRMLTVAVRQLPRATPPAAALPSSLDSMPTATAVVPAPMSHPAHAAAGATDSALVTHESTHVVAPAAHDSARRDSARRDSVRRDSVTRHARADSLRPRVVRPPVVPPAATHRP